MYKPNMRKWMRERVMRRRKPKEEAEAKPETTQAPLQPAYFDAAPTADSVASEIDGNRAEPAVQHEQPASPVREESHPPARRAPEDQPGRREKPSRRRGRGGRGRGRSEARPEVSREAAPSPVPASVVAAPPSPKGAVMLAIGLPGSGKSSWFKRNNITPLSSDMLRALLFDDPVEQRFQDLVFSNLRSMLKARLIAKRPVSYVDTTNLTPQERQNWIKLAHDYGYEVQAVYFDVPLEICLERNAKRQRVVPEDVMRRMAAKLKAPEFGEGFSKITVVRVKQKE